LIVLKPAWKLNGSPYSQDAINIIDVISTIALKLKLTFDAYPEMPDRQMETAANERFYDRETIQQCRTRRPRPDGGPDALRRYRRQAGFPETAIALASGPGS
jgi:hypothetical protein